MHKLMHDKYTGTHTDTHTHAHTGTVTAAQHEKMHLMSKTLRSAVAVLKREALNCTLVTKETKNQQADTFPDPGNSHVH